MVEWDRETWPDDYGRTQGHTKGLRLDDGTYLECYETELVNRFGEAETFEVIGLDRYMSWWGWGPHDMTVRLGKKTIQSMFDSGDLRVVSDDSPYTVLVRDGANCDEWTETVEADSAEKAVRQVHNRYSGHSHTTKLVVPEEQP